MTISNDGDAALPWHGQPYSIKRFGTSIGNCASEPVQTPGCIQTHGALLVVQPDDLLILQASENTEQVLGHPASALAGASLATVLGDDGAVRVRSFLECNSTDCNPIYLFSHPARDAGMLLDVSVHTIDGVAIVEFEETDRAGKDAPDYLSRLKASVARLQQAASLQDLGDIAAAEVRALTGLDRVMVYQFHEDGHGEVVAESRRGDLSPWLGLHYPAEDIPEPAREVFRHVWIRPLQQVGAPIAEMAPLAHPTTGKALTMTYCALRAPSAIYTEYLQNMGVTAGLTMSIRRGDKLWGLIAGHHYSGPARFPYGLRAACELLAQIVSLQHQSAEERGELAYRLKLDEIQQQLISLAARQGDLAAMCDGSPNLLDAMDAGGAALFHRDRWWCIGATPSEPQLDALKGWLQTRPELTTPLRPVVASHCLGRDYAGGAGISDVASGLLAISLSQRHSNLVIWFRPEMRGTIKWAGDPDEKPMVTGPHGARLTPRRSFEIFTASVQGQSSPWKAVEIDSAIRFRITLMELIVSRAEQLAELNADLAQSNEELDAFAYIASHDLKEPLRGIFKYVHQLGETGTLTDPSSRARLDGLKRLTLRMDSLLDSLLHFSRVGRVMLHFDDVSIDEVVAEALEMVDARRTEKASEVLIPRSLPNALCDRVRIREVFVNLLSNAFKYNDKPSARIEIGYLAPHELARRAHWPQDTGTGPVYFVRDNGIGIRPRHFGQLFKMFKRLHGRDAFGGGTGAGLAIVKKLVERHGGQVWLDSEPDQGSTFYFSLPAGTATSHAPDT